MSLFARTPGRRALVSLLLVPLGFAAWGSAQAATTYYVRTDGGDASQCTGRADAKYPGSGTGQACAWKHPFFALAPNGTKRIAGGDTLLIGSGNYTIGQGAPGAGSCSGASCDFPPIPSGTSTTRTRFLGKSASAPPKFLGTNGVKVLNLEGSSNVEVGNLEITDQSDCLYNHSVSSADCGSTGNWAKTGISASASSNVWLHDINIHGMAAHGIRAGGLRDWTVERVKLIASGRIGWDGNIGSTGSSNSGNIVWRDIEIAWNGCGERWQTGEPWGCFAQQTGGYGDGVGTVYTGGKWLIEDAFIHHNTSDGLDLRYMDGADGTHVTVRRLYAVGNAGNQAKIRGNSLVENSVLVSNCGYFEGKYYMIAADNCRANGNALQIVMTPTDTAVVRHNTIAGESGTLIGTGEGDSTGKVRIENNVLVGFPTFRDPSDSASIQYGNFPGSVTFAGNLAWNVKGSCPSGAICNTQNPKLTNMTLDAFDAEPLDGSPVVDKVAAISAVVTDFVMQPRPSGARSDIGAYEMPLAGSEPTVPPPTGETCTRATPALSLVGPTVAVAAGTKVDYTIQLTNRDSSACANTSFSLARTVPAGWIGTLGATSVNLAPGASSSTALSVSSASGSTAGTYNIAAGAGSSIGSTHTASASAAYSVKEVEPAPSPTGLTETVGTSKSSYAAGETVYMSARVLNNGVPVSGAKVNFVALKPNGVNSVKRSATTDSNGYARASFASGTGSSSIGTYKLTAKASSGKLSATASTTFSVGTTSTATPAPEPIDTGLTENVSTSKASYLAGDTVDMTARVLNNGVAVSGASVSFVALKPNGVNSVKRSATTDSNGYARASFASGTGPSSIGTYKLTAEVASGSLSASDTTTFSVLK